MCAANMQHMVMLDGRRPVCSQSLQLVCVSSPQQVSMLSPSPLLLPRLQYCRRVSNMYNGIYFQSTLFRDGRLGTDSLKRVCPLHSSWGVMRGNVVHSNQRFGWYPGECVFV